MRLNAERGVRYELVFVESNPVASRPYLLDPMRERLPGVASGPLHWIIVAPGYQTAMEQSPWATYLKYVARNVGIRRARGSLVRLTNVDNLLGRQIVDRLAAGSLDAGTIYRVLRYDIKICADQAGIVWNALEDVANQVRTPTLKPPLYNGGAADFLLAGWETLHRLRGFNEVFRAARAGVDLNIPGVVGRRAVAAPGERRHLSRLRLARRATAHRPRLGRAADAPRRRGCR